MSEPRPSLATEELAALLARLRQGDALAADELVRRTAARLECLARQMLRRYPVVRSQEQTADVLQEAALRLLAALRDVTPHGMRAFYALASQHIRFHLLDLTRRYRHGAQRPLDEHPEPLAAGTAAAEVADLERWAALHEAVEELPAEQREVFSLRFYHGCTWARIAELLNISERTARRAWLRAGLALGEALAEEVPEAASSEVT
jgi:RNA polymerase sigma-70 factor (ECF subfamily)